MATRLGWKGYTADEIRTIVKNWDKKNLREIGELIGRSSASIDYISKQIRKAGYDLPKKPRNSSITNLIKEALNIR